MGNVLVGLDGSRESLTALRWAARFAAATQRELHLVHAWQHGKPLELMAGADRSGVDELETAVAERLRQLADEELADATMVTDCRAVRGDIAGSLADEAARIGASLIVVGARGAGGARRALLGSVSRQLSSCPVHAIAVVPERAAGEEARRPMVVGVDGSAGSSRAVRWVAGVARSSGADVVAVHAFVPVDADLPAAAQERLAEEERERLEQEWCAPLRALDVPHRAALELGDARSVLRRVADSIRPECVVVGSRGLGPLSQRVLGSVTYHLVRELEWPTVVIPSPADRAIWTG